MTLRRPRRILMTADAVGGVWIYATELARVLCSRGCEVSLIVMGPVPRRDQLEALPHIRGLDVGVLDLALEWADPDGGDVQRARETLLRVARGIAPDVIHLNSYREASFDWPAPVVVVAHSCVSSWWNACRGGLPTDAHWRSYAAAVKSGLVAANAWVAPTAAFRDVMETISRPASGGRVIWNGVAAQDLAAAKQHVILAAGRFWDEAKNLTGLVAIAPRLDWSVRVAGPKSENDDTATVQNVVGVECLGWLPHSSVLAEMRRAGIFVSPALYEPFGLSVLEAASCGCALVLSDIPTFRELWNGAALFVAPRDNDALCDALQSLSRDDGLRAEMQRAARTRARRYSVARMADAYLDLYAQIQLSPVAPGIWPCAATLELQA